MSMNPAKALIEIAGIEFMQNIIKVVTSESSVSIWERCNTPNSY